MIRSRSIYHYNFLSVFYKKIVKNNEVMAVEVTSRAVSGRIWEFL